MRYNGLHNYYEINSYCKSEGVNAEYLMVEIVNCDKKKTKGKFLALLVALLKRI